MALTWNQSISVGSSKIDEGPIAEIIDNLDILYGDLLLTPPSLVKPAELSPVNSAKMQEIIDSVDIADDNNYCRTHNTDHFSVVESANKTGHNEAYDNSYNSDENGTYNSGYNSGYDSSDDGTDRGTHYSSYDGYAYSTDYTGNDTGHNGTDRGTYNSGYDSGYNSSNNSGYDGTDLGTYNSGYNSSVHSNHGA
jgi:hypothetical protein